MEFRLLGPLEVWHEGRALELRGLKRRAVLALLLVHANEVVSRDRLIDELWEEHPPAKRVVTRVRLSSRSCLRIAAHATGRWWKAEDGE